MYLKSRLFLQGALFYSLQQSLRISSGICGRSNGNGQTLPETRPQSISGARNRRFHQPIEPSRQHFHIKRISHPLTIDQLVAPVASILALQDRSGLVRPEVDFNSQITG
jgi:hypothetical protein